MYSKLFHLHIKNTLRSKSFLFAFVITLLYSLATFLYDCIPLYGTISSKHMAAYDYFGPVENCYGFSFQLWQIFFMFLFFFICSLSGGDRYCVDYTSGTYKNIFSRSQKKDYFITGSITTFFAGFITIFIPLLVNLLLWMVVAPLTTSTRLVNGELLNKLFLPSLYINQPYLFFLVNMVITSFIGGLYSLLSFSISLFYHKKRFIIVTLPGFLTIISSFIVSLFARQDLVLANYLLPVKLNTLFLWFLIPILILINILAILFKVRIVNDEL